MLKLLMPHAAALVKAGKTKTLVIADLHLGWEMALQAKGIHVPNQTSKLFDKLKALLAEYKPDGLLILGDVKYSVVASASGEWREVPQFFSEVSRFVSEIGVVRGNHDGNLEPMLPENVTMHPASGIVLGDVGLFHGHKWPSPTVLGCKTLVMGHLHPAVVFRDPAGFKLNQQVWLKAEVNAENLAKVLLDKHRVKIEGTVEETLQTHYDTKLRAKQVFVMPSFNGFLSGRSVNESKPRKGLGREALIGPLLRIETVDVENAELYLLDGTYLGTLNQLRKL